jgi:hypothetical protein
VWDKLFTMTNGGVSKATKSLHVSEDVFGGYNVMLRGRDITYVDYVAVGKGRDMGFETINTFEAKVGAGLFSKGAGLLWARPVCHGVRGDVLQALKQQRRGIPAHPLSVPACCACCALLHRSLPATGSRWCPVTCPAWHAA